MRIVTRSVAVVVGPFLVLGVLLLHAADLRAQDRPSKPESAAPVVFEETDEQHAAAKFVARAQGYTLLLDERNATLALRTSASSQRLIHLTLDGALASARMI